MRISIILRDEKRGKKKKNDLHIHDVMDSYEKTHILHIRAYTERINLWTEVLLTC
jgi:hypothetical protein